MSQRCCPAVVAAFSGGPTYPVFMDYANACGSACARSNNVASACPNSSHSRYSGGEPRVDRACVGCSGDVGLGLAVRLPGNGPASQWFRYRLMPGRASAHPPGSPAADGRDRRLTVALEGGSGPSPRTAAGALGPFRSGGPLHLASARHLSRVLHEPLIPNSTEASPMGTRLLSLDWLGSRSLR
jgi:hypothetical protein